MDTIALDVIKNQGISINAQENVLFDQVLLQKGAVQYNTNTGIVTLNKKGRYMVSWDVVTQAAVGAPGVSFGIYVGNSNQVITGTPVKNGEVVGFGIVQVDTIPTTLSIVNTENVVIYYATATQIKAHMTIGELLETTGGQPVVWESAGLQMTNNNPLPAQQITVANGNAIPFDNITVQFNGVGYGNNAIQISEVGTYLVLWDITAKAGSSISNILVFLEGTGGNVYGKSGMYAGTLAPITGSALVQIVSLPGGNPVALQLVNRSGVDLLLASVFNGATSTSTYFSGSLSVIKVADIYYT